jgi:hypothetical protein
MGVLLAGAASLSRAYADDKPPSYPKNPDAKNVPVMPEAWKTVAKAPATSAEIDQLLSKALKADKLSPSTRTSDEQFIRRVTLDLTGKLPLPADVTEFMADKDPKKRAKLIDRLLASDDFAQHWARYWHDVIVSRATDERIKRLGITKAFTDWLTDQLKANRNWGQIAREMMTVDGALKYGPDSNDASNGAAVFLLCHQGAEAAVERAAETSRVFMGIQIQCAQCHDHPSDIWKRQQFHELTAFYARLREQPIRDGQRITGIQLVSRPGGEHQMPNLNDPKQTTTIQPKFLTGESYNAGRNDADRRKALAEWITSKENYWFSAAFVNRAWGEMMGQAFYQPVDCMGPLQQATYPEVLLRMAGSFQATDYNVKELFRLIANSEAYQRQIRLGDSPDEHLHFAGAYPTRLNADTLWDALLGALGPMPGGPRPQATGPAARFAGRFGLERQFKDAFGFDPSTKSDEVEGSIPQALMLMNNPAITGQMRAAGNTVLAKILTAYPQDEEAIRMVYLRTLARKPTNKELDTCRDYVRKVGNRPEAFEDILWSLINSTEFQTKR